MTDFIYFLGRFHVLALHLPIGILLLTVILDFLSKSPRHAYLSPVLPLCWAGTAITAILTVVLGLMHFSEGGFDGPSASAHRNYGISVAVISMMVWFLSAKLPALYKQSRIYTNLLLLFLITMTGHYGGNLTHGNTFLVEYAPQPLRTLAGLSAKRAPVTDINQADPWHDVVSPILDSRCLSCHNNDKQRGGLDLSSLDALLVGGESGAVVLSGNAEGSDLYRRITLPENHDDFMPAEGKTPLSESQVRLLGWWIDQGMPAETTVAALPPEGDMIALLSAELGLAGAAIPAAPVTTDSVYPAISPDVFDRLINQGWLIRPLLQNSNGLVASVNSIGQPVSRQMLETLSEAGHSIVDLNLASTGLNDELLMLIADMPALENLNISNNGISDAGMKVVAGYGNLKVLNLYGNPAITDAGLETLSTLDQLETLYTWGTSVTSEGMNVMADIEIAGQSALELQ